MGLRDATISAPRARDSRAGTYSDLRSSEARTGIQPHTVPSSTPVHLDLARIRLEAVRGILGRDAALDRVATLGDCLLREAELGERRSSSDLDLGGDDIDSRDLLRDGVLDLDTGWKRARQLGRKGEKPPSNARLISMK